MRTPNPIRLKDSWVLCFALGVVMLNFPFIEIFNKSATLFGVPVLILYLMLGWPASILVIFLFSRQLGNNHEPQEPAEKDQE